ncbi:MAG: hypothetical protein ACR650_06050 [Methylocystis sp.]|jgi:hypothetical protein
MSAYDRDFAEASQRSPLRARPAGVRAALGMGAGASTILAVAALAFRAPAPAPDLAGSEAPAIKASPAKITAKAGMEGESVAVASLDIAAPELDHEKKVVAIGETRNGDVRADSLTIGQFGGGGTFLRIDVHPALDPRATNADFFLDMKNHAEAAGLTASRIVQRAAVPTRFGAFETADIRLSQAGGEGAQASERACLAARLVEPKASLEIAGIACGAAAKPIDRVALACLLDKLSYSAGSDNRALNDFFLSAELARGKGCANVSRDDLTASIPTQKAGRSKPVNKPSTTVKKKAHVAARPAAVSPETAKTVE